MINEMWCTVDWFKSPFGGFHKRSVLMFLAIPITTDMFFYEKSNFAHNSSLVFSSDPVLCSFPWILILMEIRKKNSSTTTCVNIKSKYC